MTPDELIQTLERLNALRVQGLLTDIEVEAEKQKILSTSLQSPGPVGAAVTSQNVSFDPAGKRLGFNAISDAITSRLGLDKVEEFSLGKFFSNVFGKHDRNEIENIFSVGTMFTTPSLDKSMSNFPSPWVFFRVLIASAIVYGLFYFAWATFQNPIMIPGLMFSGAFAIPFATLILFFELNTPRNVSITCLSAFVFVGGTVSLIASLFLFGFTSLDSYLGASAAGFIEEPGKLVAVLISLSFVDRSRYPYRLNALLFGAAVGTGFAIFETAGYLLGTLAQSGDMGQVSDLVTLRGLMSPFAHIAWSAISATAYWNARRKHNSMMEALVSPDFLKIFIVPVVLHFIWNLGLATPVYVALGFIAWVIVLSFVQTGLREIGEAVEAQKEEFTSREQRVMA